VHKSDHLRYVPARSVGGSSFPLRCPALGDPPQTHPDPDRDNMRLLFTNVQNTETLVAALKCTGERFAFDPASGAVVLTGWRSSQEELARLSISAPTRNLILRPVRSTKKKFNNFCAPKHPGGLRVLCPLCPSIPLCRYPLSKSLRRRPKCERHCTFVPLRPGREKPLCPQRPGYRNFAPHTAL
jgi:hypothetical protein